jgi:hypothetical protein
MVLLLFFAPLRGSTFNVTQAALADTFIAAWHRFFWSRGNFGAGVAIWGQKTDLQGISVFSG